jgi:hypothetical protein
MPWSHALVAGNRHADLLAEAASRRLAEGNRQVGVTVQPIEPAARDRSRRLSLPWRPAVVR